MLSRTGIFTVLKRPNYLPRYALRTLSTRSCLRVKDQGTSGSKSTPREGASSGTSPSADSSSQNAFPRVTQPNNNGFEDVSPKRKPLSRIAIGGTETKSQKATSGSIEFATWKAAALVLTLGGTLYYFFSKEKRRLEIEKEAEANRGYGKPLVGGPFKLVDFNGNEFTEKNLLGKFSIIYFGFSHCPDICPDELDKLSEWLDGLKKKGIELQPIFITCDPARDPPHVLKEYLSEFHPDLIGLTGEYNDIKNACKQYRVYFSTPPSLKPGQDYLVDHSIFFYLMDPEGQFIDALGRQYDAETGVAKIEEHVKAYVPREQREKRKEKWYSFLFN
ncbi:LAQU0S07e01112g1_1 [Lachancea quebecensis]|uniref:LAQU0S07e01112g1_1 n=1 Tax=Lachancea quebecensis TaxID=1654605 RepID=A0A0P1KSL2_9SACH|nr:LAQU0S07e01112g1_1 [Lachancea quebecensis]